jgi:hypothetical protein
MQPHTHSPPHHHPKPYPHVPADQTPPQAYKLPVPWALRGHDACSRFVFRRLGDHRAIGMGVKSGRVSGKQCECRGDVTARPTHHNQDTKTDFGRVICLLVSGYVDICSLAEELYFAGHIAIAISQHVHIPCTGLTVAFWYARCA